jgi:hypothetical protein
MVIEVAAAVSEPSSTGVHRGRFAAHANFLGLCRRLVIREAIASMMTGPGDVRLVRSTVTIILSG